MAIYHCSVKTISRSAGRSATAAAAYRAAERIIDERTGEIHDYRRKGGIQQRGIVVPAGERAPARAALWNMAEIRERRKNSTVAREVVLALPAELDADQKADLAETFARHLAERYRVAVDLAVHAPDRQGDDRNHHAHLLMTTRRLESGVLTDKTRELDNRNSGEVQHIREAWATAANAALAKAGHAERIDHRSHETRQLEQIPTQKMGPAASAMERRGERSDRGDINREARKYNALVADLHQVDQAIAREKEALSRAASHPGRTPQQPTAAPVPAPKKPKKTTPARKATVTPIQRPTVQGNPGTPPDKWKQYRAKLYTKHYKNRLSPSLLDQVQWIEKKRQSPIFIALRDGSQIADTGSKITAKDSPASGDAIEIMAQMITAKVKGGDWKTVKLQGPAEFRWQLQERLDALGVEVTNRMDEPPDAQVQDTMPGPAPGHDPP